MKPWEESWWVHNNAASIFEICRPGQDDESDVVATVTSEDCGGGSFADQCAMAHMGAAAPELYRALQVMMTIEDWRDGSEPKRDMYRQAEAALAKARGET